MRSFLLVFSISFTLCSSVNAQVYGCMDPYSSNYNSLATISDGSCIYPDASVALKDFKKVTLPSTISEISGMILINGKLYGHNDSGGQSAIYAIDTTTGIITKTIILEGTKNIDWEDLTQDADYVYVGDMGNNNTGNRTDLKIYRFPKQDLDNISGISGTIPSSDISEIKFRYEDQTDFTTKPSERTRFDCEAIIYDHGQLHLFTKNWLSNYTVHYVMSADPLPGVQVAIREDSLNTQGTLITSAGKLNTEVTVLLGYEVTGYPSASLWVISGYSDMNHLFTSGNKRKVGLGKIVDVANGGGIGQVEGLTVLKEGSVLISNELFTRTLAGITFFVPQSLYSLNIKPWLPQSIILPVGISHLSAKVNEGNVLLSWQYNSAEADYFDIEKSSDGEHFSKIGALNNMEPFADEFDYTDDAHFAGQQFYRIKVVLKDKNYSFSKILVVKGNLNEFFKLETSSFSNKIKIDFNSGKEQAVQLSLVDLYGRILVTRKLNCFKGNNHCELNNLSSLSKSVYFVTAKASDGLFVKKVVKD